MKRRRKFTTTKNNHSSMTSKKVSSSSEMKKIETAQMENFKGQKIGINFAIKIPDFEKPFTGAGVYQLDGFDDIHSRFLKNLNESKINSNFDGNDITCTQILIYQYMKKYIDENFDGEGVNCNDEFTTQMVEFCMSYSMLVDFVQEKTEDSYNKYITLEMTYTNETGKHRKKVSTEWEVHSTFEEFSNKGEELIKVINPDYEDVHLIFNTHNEDKFEEDVDQVQIVDEPIEYTVDDIIIIDDAPIPMLGLNYEILTKLKDSMTILQVGQTIKLPKDDRLRSSVYLLNKQHFSEKRFSVYEINDNYIVFLNTKNKE
jgi:hypothetical protein